MSVPSQDSAGHTPIDAAAAPGSSALPLAGVRILSAEQYGAGPYGSMTLADLGAEVIKIENPSDGGDVARKTGPYLLDTPDHSPDSQFFQSFNRNKKSLTLDLKSEQGQSVFKRLVASANAVMNNLRGDLPERLGLDYPALKAIKPSIVCAHLSAYGRHNERRNWPGYDYLMQAEAGYLHLTGEPDQLPTRMGLSIVDYMTGITTATGLLAALVGAGRTGIGRDVDVSLFDVALAQLTYPATWFLNAGHITGRTPRSAHPSTVPCQLVKSADGWVFVMCMTPRFWHNLCVGIDKPHWLEDERFADPSSRYQHRTQLSGMLDEVFAVRSSEAWLNALAGSLPIAPVLDLPQALTNPYVKSVGMISSTDQASGEPLQQLASPIQLDGKRLPVSTCSTLSADTQQLLAEAGYSDEQIHELQAGGVV